MTVFVIRRLAQSLLVLFATSAIVFAGIYAVGNPIDIPVAADATPAEQEQAIRSLGLDRSLVEQYGTFVCNALQGDLGRSFVFNQPSIELILSRMPATLELAFVALALSLVIGIPLGLWAGLRPSAADRSKALWRSACPETQIANDCTGCSLRFPQHDARSNLTISPVRSRKNERQ